MNTDKTLGQELIEAVQSALDAKEKGRLVRPNLDISEIRKQLGLTQKEFSATYHIKLQTLRNWEQHKRIPDITSLAYLTCIAKQPKVIQKILLNGKS